MTPQRDEVFTRWQNILYQPQLPARPFEKLYQQRSIAVMTIGSMHWPCREILTFQKLCPRRCLLPPRAGMEKAESTVAHLHGEQWDQAWRRLAGPFEGTIGDALNAREYNFVRSQCRPLQLRASSAQQFVVEWSTVLGC